MMVEVMTAVVEVGMVLTVTNTLVVVVTSNSE